MKKIIYLDNAATTPLSPEVKAAMEPYLSMYYGNASTSYEIGDISREAIEKAREKIAKCLNAKASEIYFTSGGTESDNWAIKGFVFQNMRGGRHIITSKIEHHAVIHSCKYLKEFQVRTSYIAPDIQGVISANRVERSIERDTILISIMHGNNEIGTIEPIEEIGNLARKKGIVFHTDAVQTVGHVPIDLKRLPVDMLSASAHKFNGPKGIGFIYVREGIDLPSYIHGGTQERGMRAGTENVASIVGMGKALEIACSKMDDNRKYIKGLREYFVSRVMNEIDDVVYNGHPSKRLPGNMSFSFKGIDAQMLLVLLAEQGICAASGSACNADSTKLSHVIQAIEAPIEYAPGTIRFSIDASNTMGELATTLGALKKSISILRMV